MDELVRDFVPALALLERAHLHFDVAPREDLGHLAMDKLLRLVKEWKQADSEAGQEVLADMYELLLVVMAESNMTVEDALFMIEEKDRRKGGFHFGFVVKED